MDDFSVRDERLQAALRDLAWINRWLGGHAAPTPVLLPLLHRYDRLRVLDLATGGADYPAFLVRLGARHGCRVEVTGLDANPATVDYARQRLDRGLSPALRAQVTLTTGDALGLAYADDAFDVTTAALFLHHLYGAEAVQLLREMDRVSRLGLIVNDLHRHGLAYVGIWALSRLLGLAPMVQHDAPLSVRRGFRRSELLTLARKAGCTPVSIRWRWAFRWVLTTLPLEASRPGGTAPAGSS